MILEQTSIRPCEVPQDSLLRRYVDGVGFADCYVTEVPRAVSQGEFVEAFYTSSLFKIERTLLTYLASRPAGDAEAQQLAAGTARAFSAWSVQEQSATELLLADFTSMIDKLTAPDQDYAVTRPHHAL